MYLAIDRYKPLSNLAVERWCSLATEARPLVSKASAFATNVGSFNVLALDRALHVFRKTTVMLYKLHHPIEADRSFSERYVDKEKGSNGDCKFIGK
jgi:hypothetical protein